MIEVDGSSGEGGGQILRSAVALASVLGTKIEVSNIRAGRSNPGIRAQHLVSVRAASEICGAITAGAEEGSRRLEYRPGKPRGGRFRFDVGTAGSVTLVLQTLIPILAFAGEASEIHLIGGTDVKWSPPVDYSRLVTLPYLERMGFSGNLKLVKRGYYPRGGGEVKFSSLPVDSIRPITGRSSGQATQIDIVSYSTGLPRHVAERQAMAAEQSISSNGLPNARVTVDPLPSNSGLGPGSGIVLRGATDLGALIGADRLGEKGKPAEEVGAEAGRRMVEELGTGMFLDRHMGDMVVPYMALADGVSEVSVSQITEHTLTNIKVAELLAGVRFEVRGKSGEPGTLRVRGCGFRSATGFSSPK